MAPSVSEKASSFSFRVTAFFLNFQIRFAGKPEKLSQCGFFQLVQKTPVYQCTVGQNPRPCGERGREAQSFGKIFRKREIGK